MATVASVFKPRALERKEHIFRANGLTHTDQLDPISANYEWRLCEFEPAEAYPVVPGSPI
jgi:hypothetical protein